MRLYVVCNRDDTATGLRLAGIDGVVVSSAKEAEEKIAELQQDREIGIILINLALMAECGDFVKAFRKKYSLPLITEIPDADGKKGSDSIARYVREAVGIRE